MYSKNLDVSASVKTQKRQATSKFAEAIETQAVGA